ncbi:MAG: hypothetical protein HOV94_01140 [Saccharothrix sp.]|nr:hypothetical protein [Saccharothrix sp.]
MNGRGPLAVELRVHGVSGTAPEKTLGDPFPKAVAGDDVARFLRATKPVETGTRSRVVEAFHWGRFTSGGASRALWLLLIPFALVNLARYTLLRPDKRSDAVLRLLGGVLTSMFVANVTYVSLELVVRQCAAVDACRSDNRWLGFLADWPFGVMLLVGGLPPGLVILLFWWFGRQTFLYSHRPPTSGDGDPPAADSLGDYAFWQTSAQTQALRDTHVALACLTTGLLYGGTLETSEATRVPDWLESHLPWSYLSLAWASWALWKPSESRGRALKWFSVCVLGVGAAAATGFLWERPGQGAVPPVLAGFEVVSNSHLPVAALLLVVLTCRCCSARRAHDGDRKLRKSFEPFWCGLGAVCVATVGTVVAAGFSVGLAYRVADILSEPIVAGTGSSARIELNTGYQVGALWGALGILFLLAAPVLAALMSRQPRTTVVLLAEGAGFGVAAFALSWTDVPDSWYWSVVGLMVLMYAAGGRLFAREWRDDRVHSLVEADYRGRPAVSDVTTKKIAMKWRLAAMKYRYHWVVGTLALMGGLLLVLSCVAPAVGVLEAFGAIEGASTVGAWPRTEVGMELSEVGSWMMSALVFLLVVIGVRTWRDGRMRTAVGILWDLVGFWPRMVHPLCPPPYGGRATIELTKRAAHLVNKHHVHSVVLSGHSKGSVVCAAAVLLLHKECGRSDDGVRFLSKDAAAKTLEHLSFVSYGSQLQWAYARLFPHYLGKEQLATVFDAVGGRWYNMYRWTDPLGGPVLSWPYNRMPGPESETDVEFWLALNRDWSYVRLAGAPGRWGLRRAHDIRLRDPEFVHQDPDVPSSPIRGHSGYYEDPVFNRVVALATDRVGMNGDSRTPSTRNGAGQVRAGERRWR